MALIKADIDISSRKTMAWIAVIIVMMQFPISLFLCYFTWHHLWVETLLDMAHSILCLIALLEILRWQMHNSEWLSPNLTAKRTVILSIKLIALQILAGALLCPISVYLQDALVRVIDYDNYVTVLSRYIYAAADYFNIGMMTDVAMMVTVMIAQQRQRQREHLQLQIANAEKETDLLRQQLSPHFLFNSLNTLQGLISPDNEAARQFLLKLSSVYRYLLRQAGWTTLQDEYDFTMSYIYLMQVRYGDGLQVQVAIPDEWMQYRLPSISLQALVENAIKHNVISLQKPLRVSISSMTKDEQPWLRVSNNLQPKQVTTTERSGTGLSNLSTRYRMSGMADIIINKTDSDFTVEIPLKQ